MKLVNWKPKKGKPIYLKRVRMSYDHHHLVAVLDERRAEQEAKRDLLDKELSDITKQIDEIIALGIGEGLSVDELKEAVEKMKVE